MLPHFQNLFFPVFLRLVCIKKGNMKAIRFFHLSDGFHKLELCIGLNPFFFIFVLLFHFGVLRYVFLGPYLRFLSLWGNSLCSRWSVLSFCFFFRFLLSTLLYQFSSCLSTLYFDFLYVFYFCSVSFYLIVVIFRLLSQNIPAESVSKRIRQGHFHDLSLFLNQQGFSCHFFWLLHTHQLDQGRCDVCQASALS